MEAAENLTQGMEVQESPPIIETFGLEPRAINAAYMYASGFYRDSDITEKLERSVAWFAKLKIRPEFKLLVQRAIAEYTEKRVSSVSDASDMLNGEIYKSIQTIVDIRDDLKESGKTRLSASTTLLDRAPNAPKMQKNVENRSFVFQIPVRSQELIESTLEEEGEGALVELLSGVDFEEIEEEEEGEGALEMEMEMDITLPSEGLEIIEVGKKKKE